MKQADQLYRIPINGKERAALLAHLKTATAEDYTPELLDIYLRLDKALPVNTPQDWQPHFTLYGVSERQL